MSTNKHTSNNSYTGIIIGVIAIIAVIVLSFVTSGNEEKSRAKMKERFVASIAKWIEAKGTKTLSASARKEIAECVYEVDDGILYYRSNLKRQEDIENEGRIISSSKYHAYGDFLTDLESYVNGGSGKIMQTEADMINEAISKCKKKLNY